MPEAVTRQNIFGRRGNDRCLAVVMPIYNEAATVSKIIPTVLAQPIVAQLIAVDDGSTDQTWEHLSALRKRDQRLILHRHEVNCGKGAALRTGFAVATCNTIYGAYSRGEIPWCDYAGRPLLADAHVNGN